MPVSLGLKDLVMMNLKSRKPNPQIYDGDQDFYDLDACFHQCMYDNLENMIQVVFLDSVCKSDCCVQGKRPSAKELRVRKERDFTTTLCGRTYEAFVKSLVFPFPYTYKLNSLDMEQ